MSYQAAPPGYSVPRQADAPVYAQAHQGRRRTPAAHVYANPRQALAEHQLELARRHGRYAQNVLYQGSPDSPRRAAAEAQGAQYREAPPPLMGRPRLLSAASGIMRPRGGSRKSKQHRKSKRNAKQHRKPHKTRRA